MIVEHFERQRDTVYIKLSLIYIASALFAYLLWVFFSYLVVPVEPPYRYKIRNWPQDGYYKIIPGKYKNHKYNTFYTINSKGFRGPEFLDKGSKYRIITIGGSSTIGIESNDSETWPSQLQKFVTENGHSVEVINVGIGGARSVHHIKMFKTK